jgi:hypothetical protein
MSRTTRVTVASQLEQFLDPVGDTALAVAHFQRERVTRVATARTAAGIAQ